MGSNKITNLKNNKIIMTFIIFSLFIVTVSIIYLIFNHPFNKQTDPTKDPSYKITYVDPGSGATIVTMPNIGPEKAMNDVDTIVTGLDRFTEIGIQKPQRDKLWGYFIKYASSQKVLIKEISVTVASIKKINTEADDSRSINFEITTDRTIKLKAEIIYSGSSNLRLKIFNDKNKLIYDSK